VNIHVVDYLVHFSNILMLVSYSVRDILLVITNKGDNMEFKRIMLFALLATSLPVNGGAKYGDWRVARR